MKLSTYRVAKTVHLRTCLCAAMFLLLTSAILAQPPGAAAERKVFSDSVVPLPPQTGLTLDGLNVQAADADHKFDKMSILFSLTISKEAQQQLEQKISRGDVVAPEVLERDYSARPEDVAALVTWLKSQGFKVTGTSGQGTSVYAEATVSQIESSLHVQMVRVSKDGFTYNAARNAPSLPADISTNVRAIIGLQPFLRAHKHIRSQLPLTNRDEPLQLGAGAADAVPSPSISNAPPYLVKEVLRAYSADGLGLTGAGQKIAILIDTFPAPDDLKEFWKKNGLAVPSDNVEQINVGGGLLPPREEEETLDVEWTTGIAPGAKVRVYASGSLAFVDLDRALDRIIDDLKTEPGMRQLSISLGLGETYMGGPDGEVATEHQKFMLLAGAGVNVFVSSGDAGSNPDGTGHGSTGPQQAEYESSDPLVIGVGGTTLKLAANGSVNNETGWSGSGGGISVLFDRPGYQAGEGIKAGTKRLVPDVSFAADPGTGAFLFYDGQVVQIGGTSWSAPAWAGLCALMNEARAKANKPSLPFLNPLLYPLIGTPCFRDIKQGNNGVFDAGDGYDMVTGIGVPNMKELTKELIK